MYVTYADLFQLLMMLFTFGSMIIALIALFLGERK